MTLPQSNLDARVEKVMASEVGAFLGLSKNASPIEAWAYNLRKIEPKETTAAMDAGNFLEAGLVAWAAKITGLPFVHNAEQRPMFHPLEPWAGCTPDALALREIGLQIKVRGFNAMPDYRGLPSETEGQADNDLLPEGDLIQTHWEMWVMGAQVWYLGVYFGGADFRLYRIVRDDDLLRMLVEKAREFWQRHLDPKGPQTEPPLDGSAATTEYLRKRYPKPAPGKIIQPTDDLRAWAERYRECSAKIGELEAAKAEARNNIIAVMGDAEEIEGLCTFKAAKGRTDWKAVALHLVPNITFLAPFIESHTAKPSRRFLLKGE